MSHTPFGYQIKNGKAIVDMEEAEKIRVLFQSYLAGAALTTAAKEAAIHVSHSSIHHILQTTHYIGDDYYPAIIDADTFTAAQKEITNRAKKLGRIREPKKTSPVLYPTTFSLAEKTQTYTDPFQQAEYAYSLIESEESIHGITDAECHNHSGTNLSTPKLY